MNWLQARLREPSTWIGLATATAGVGAAFKINEAPQLADTLSGVGQAVSAGAPWYVWGPLALGGLLAAIMKERGAR